VRPTGHQHPRSTASSTRQYSSSASPTLYTASEREAVYPTPPPSLPRVDIRLQPLEPDPFRVAVSTRSSDPAAHALTYANPSAQTHHTSSAHYPIYEQSLGALSIQDDDLLSPSYDTNYSATGDSIITAYFASTTSSTSQTPRTVSHQHSSIALETDYVERTPRYSSAGHNFRNSHTSHGSSGGRASSSSSSRHHRDRTETSRR